MSVHRRLGLCLGIACFLASVPAAFAQFSPNQELPLPLLAPVGGPNGPLSFIVRGLEPSIRVGPDGAVYVVSIRGVPGGVDLHRYFAAVDGAANADGTYPFKYEGRPDACGIFSFGCDFLGVAEGGGDADIAVNFPAAGVPNLALTSLTLAPGVTATPYDQFIYEFGSWLHLSFTKDREPRRQASMIGKWTKGKYEPLDLEKVLSAEAPKGGFGGAITG